MVDERDHRLLSASFPGVHWNRDFSRRRDWRGGRKKLYLATQFQNIVYDCLPSPLKDEIYAWLHKNCSDEKRPEQTEDQFIYKTRKKALGPFKRQVYSLPRGIKNKISSALEEEFSFLFEKLSLNDTRVFVERYVKPTRVERKKEDFL